MGRIVHKKGVSQAEFRSFLQKMAQTQQIRKKPQSRYWKEIDRKKSLKYCACVYRFDMDESEQLSLNQQCVYVCNKKQPTSTPP